MKKMMAIGIVVFILYFALLCVTTHESYFPATKETFVNEYWDRSIHFLRGSWYPLHKIPYKEVFCEQLPMANYLFALPFVAMPKYDLDKTAGYFTCDYFPLGSKDFPLIRPSLYKSIYMIIFSFFMAIFGLASLYLLLLFLKALNKNLNYAFIFLLPPVLYFIFNRFDIFPALISLLSLYAVYKGRYNVAAVLLAVGVMAKAYMLVCLPIIISYDYYQNKRINFKMIAIFAVTIVLIILPILIKGGLAALSVPFKFQLKENINNESVYFLFNMFFPRLFEQYRGLINNLFLILSLSAIPFAITTRIDNFKLLVKWCLLAMLIFMFFMKFYSPQWIIWVIFLLILNIESISDILRIVLFEILTYLAFPVAYHIYGVESGQFIILAVLRNVVILCLIILLAKELFPLSRIFPHKLK